MYKLVRKITDREFEVYLLLGRGYGTREIADKLDISVRTIESHERNAWIKLGLSNSNTLIRDAILYIYSNKLESEEGDKVYFPCLSEADALTSLSDLCFSDSLSCITPRETEVYELVGQGLKSQEIANQLLISTKTVETHSDNIKRKLGFKSTTELLFHSVLYCNRKYLRNQRNEAFGF